MEGGDREEEEYPYRIFIVVCYIRAYGKAGNGNKMKIGNRNWKLGMGPKNAPITGAMFSSGTHEWCTLSLLFYSTQQLYFMSHEHCLYL